jgi:hypothetical protein
MMTIVLLFDFSEVFATILEMETGGLLMRDMKRRRRTTLLKEESVRPGRSQHLRGLREVLGEALVTYGPRSGRASRAI